MPQQPLVDLFMAGVQAVLPENAVTGALESITDEFTAIVSTGKAAPRMVNAAVELLGQLPTLVVSDRAEAAPPGATVMVAEHPLPGPRSLVAGAAVLEVCRQLGPADHLLYLLSGGTSSLVETPVGGVTLVDIRAVTDALLLAGASIAELNAVRARLSVIKGGGLSRAAGTASITTLALSDVVGDDSTAIGSGPTTGPPSIDPVSVAMTYGVLESMSPGAVAALDTPRPVKPAGNRRYEVVASGADAAKAVVATARARGLRARVATTSLNGEARTAALRALDMLGPGDDVVVLAGETTVTVTGSGTGGRNQEAAVAAAIALAGSDVVFLAAGTDGIDGPTTGAGGAVDGDTAAVASAAGLDARAALAANDSAQWLAAVDAQIVTGPTGTNVGDLWIVARRDALWTHHGPPHDAAGS